MIKNKSCQTKSCKISNNLLICSFSDSLNSVDEPAQNYLGCFNNEIFIFTSFSGKNLIGYKIMIRYTCIFQTIFKHFFDAHTRN